MDLRFKVTLGRHHEDWTRRNPLQPCCLNPVFKANWEFSERQPRRCIQATKQALASALGDAWRSSSYQPNGCHWV